MNLREVAMFTEINNHLPGVLSAKEVCEDKGIILNSYMETNLEKIEELFLYTIEQQKQLEIKEEKIRKLEEILKRIEKRLKI